jgi:hypothetical protein
MYYAVCMYLYVVGMYVCIYVCMYVYCYLCVYVYVLCMHVFVLCMHIHFVYVCVYVRVFIHVTYTRARAPKNKFAWCFVDVKLSYLPER